MHSLVEQLEFEMSELSIKVTIAGRSYPLTIEVDEEENVRRAAKEINNAVEALQSNYAVQDKQDLLAMVALEMSTKVLNKPENMESEGILKKIAELEELLTGVPEKSE